MLISYVTGFTSMLVGIVILLILIAVKASLVFVLLPAVCFFVGFGIEMYCFGYNRGLREGRDDLAKIVMS